jgi:hypothetical protein
MILRIAWIVIPGRWYDFWTRAKLEGGREISRPVDLATMPLCVRAGSLLALQPVKQYTAEKAEGPLVIWIYPGVDGQTTLYEDDGLTLGYRKGEWMGIRMAWSEQKRKLSLRLAEGSRMLPPLSRPVEVRIVSEETRRSLVFEGRLLELTLQRLCSRPATGRPSGAVFIRGNPCPFCRTRSSADLNGGVFLPGLRGSWRGHLRVPGRPIRAAEGARARCPCRLPVAPA